jgi:p-aminobenzoyl-glutamate transporter AbgT
LEPNVNDIVNAFLLVYMGLFPIMTEVAISVVWMLLFLAWEVLGLPYGPT